MTRGMARGVVGGMMVSEGDDGGIGLGAGGFGRLG